MGVIEELKELIINQGEEIKELKALVVEKHERPMTKKEVADYLGVVIGTIDRYMREGMIPYTKVGRNVRFHKKEIDKQFNI